MPSTTVRSIVTGFKERPLIAALFATSAIAGAAAAVAALVIFSQVTRNAGLALFLGIAGVAAGVLGARIGRRANRQRTRFLTTRPKRLLANTATSILIAVIITIVHAWNPLVAVLYVLSVVSNLGLSAFLGHAR